MTTPAWLDVPPWMPLEAPLLGTEDNRSAHLLLDIVRQFDVERAPRYAPKDGRTWCKTFLWDVLSALDCGEVAAHWVDRSGVPTKPRTMGARETRANDVVQRLSHRLYSWREATPDEAYAHAELGRPAVVGWFNLNGGPGHVAIVLPGRVIAQAGKTNFVGRPLASGFGSLPVSFWTHP